ncbi:MAG: MATE family efflux transporter, partial [Oscillospiraceae bacterium]|nr:MATE family efflux transporter [Oscillospiraceae bacterium]
NQFQFILTELAFGIGMGIVVLASQYWGQGRTEPIKKIISVGVKLSFVIGFIFFAFAATMPRQILSLYTQDEAVIAEGVRYLRITCWTFLIFSVSNSLMYSLQSVETAMIGTVMSISTIIINICLNYCLIYGNFGFPELGTIGAAIATLISRSVELIIVLVYVRFIDRKLRMKISDLVRFDFTFFRDYIKVAAPVAISGGLWGVALSAQTAVLGHIGSQVVAANSISTMLFDILAVFGMASASASSVVMGKTIGEGRLDMVRSYTKTLQGIYVIIGLIAGTLLLVLRNVIVDIYSISEETRALTSSFIFVLGITTIGTCYEYPVESGIISGGGLTKYPAIVDNLFMWLFTIPSAILSAFVFGFPPIVTFCFLKADQLLKCIPNAIVVNRFRWVRILTREEKQPHD